MAVFQLPSSLLVLEQPLEDYLEALPVHEGEALRARMIAQPALAQHMAMALRDMILLLGALFGADDGAIDTLLRRVHQRAIAQQPEILAIQRVHADHARDLLGRQNVDPHDRARLERHLNRLDDALRGAAAPVR